MIVNSCRRDQLSLYDSGLMGILFFSINEIAKAYVTTRVLNYSASLCAAFPLSFYDALFSSVTESLGRLTLRSLITINICTVRYILMEFSPYEPILPMIAL